MRDVIIKGEDKTIVALVNIGDSRDISTATEVTAVLKDRSRTNTTENGDTIVCTDTGDADWRAGKVAVPYTALQTASLYGGSGFELELKITIDGKIRKGLSSDLVDVYDSDS